MYSRAARSKSLYLLAPCHRTNWPQKLKDDFSPATAFLIYVAPCLRGPGHQIASQRIRASALQRKGATHQQLNSSCLEDSRWPSSWLTRRRNCTQQSWKISGEHCLRVWPEFAAAKSGESLMCCQRQSGLESRWIGTLTLVQQNCGPIPVLVAQGQWHSPRKVVTLNGQE